LKGFPTTAGPLFHGGDQPVGRKPKAAQKQINGQKIQLAGSSNKD